MMDFEWDGAKADANEAKHGVPFELARRVFDDSACVMLEDARKSYGEERFVALGMSQAAFAEAFGFALHALQEWEQGRAEPPQAIRRYLRVIDREPEAVMRALA